MSDKSKQTVLEILQAAGVKDPKVPDFSSEELADLTAEEIEEVKEQRLKTDTRPCTLDRTVGSADAEILLDRVANLAYTAVEETTDRANTLIGKAASSEHLTYDERIDAIIKISKLNVQLNSLAKDIEEDK